MSDKFEDHWSQATNARQNSTGYVGDKKHFIQHSPSGGFSQLQHRAKPKPLQQTTIRLNDRHKVSFFKPSRWPLTPAEAMPPGEVSLRASGRGGGVWFCPLGFVLGFFASSLMSRTAPEPRLQGAIPAVSDISSLRHGLFLHDRMIARDYRGPRLAVGQHLSAYG